MNSSVYVRCKSEEERQRALIMYNNLRNQHDLPEPVLPKSGDNWLILVNKKGEHVNKPITVGYDQAVSVFDYIQQYGFKEG